MTISEILSNEELRQREFPVAREKVFLAHAGVCPLPRRVADAMKNCVEAATQGDQETTLPPGLIPQCRNLAARLIGSTADEIALVGPTSLALSFVAGGLRFRRNDNVLVYFDDYPSNVYPWMALADRGVRVRFLNTRELGLIRPVDVIGQVDESTRLVALASCHYVAGYRIDLAAIGQALRQRNILFCVDGIQTLGAFPTEARHFDFLAADAHKWMLGPCGAGILYVRKELQETLRPMVFGWNNVQCPDFLTQEDMTLRAGARRYEAGTHSLAGLVGLRAAMELLLEAGIDDIAAELARKRKLLAARLQEKGWTILQSAAPEANLGSILSCHKPNVDLAALHQRLEAAGIITSLRAAAGDKRYIRFSPHFYNTDAELERAMEFF